MKRILPTEIEVIGETKWWIAIGKPPGIVVESFPGHPSVEDSISDLLEKRDGRMTYLGIVHRIDRVTSGIVLMAKRRAALKNLSSQFEKRLVRKVYLAITNVAPARMSGRLEHYIVKDDLVRKTVISKNATKGKLAVLNYHIRQIRDNRYMWRILPQTGRFHQIRAQLSHIGCPILGDVKYGGEILEIQNCIALHAHALTFRDPETSKVVRLVVDPPEIPFRMF